MYPTEHTSHARWSSRAAQENRPTCREEVPLPFGGESTSQADYKAPPLGAGGAVLVDRQAPSLHVTPARTTFEGRSSTHNDYLPPPLEAFRSLQPAIASPSRESQPRIPFDGKSSTHADYVAPPATALAAHMDSQSLLARQPCVQDLVHPQGSRETVSTAHHDYQPPSLQALREALVQSGIETPPSMLPRPKFEGESCAHRDFQAPPSIMPAARAPLSSGAAIQELLQPSGSAPGESTAHHDFRAPPLGLLRQGAAVSGEADEVAPVPQARFEGESTAQADYKRPPLDAVKTSLVDYPKPSLMLMADLDARFEGQSKSHCDYQPPPLEAFWQTSSMPPKAISESQPRIPFEGRSSTHADYVAPPATALAAHMDSQSLLARQPCVQDLVHPQGSRETVSTAHHDYQPPSLQALREALVQSGIETPPSMLPRPKFEGESCAHRDFQAPPSIMPAARAPLSSGAAIQELLQPSGSAPGESTAHHDFRAPPLGLLRQGAAVSGEADEVAPVPQARFEGESTAQADYKRPPLDAVKTSLVDYPKPSLMLMADLDARFEGQSKSHCDYQPPPLEALMESLRSEAKRAKGQEDYQDDGCAAIRFEGISTTQHDFSHPPKEAYRKEPTRRGSNHQEIFLDLDHKPESKLPTTQGQHQTPPLQNLWEWLKSSEQQGSESAGLLASDVKQDGKQQGQPELRHSSSQTANFVPKPTAQADKLPPTRSADIRNERSDTERLEPLVRFDGESSMRAHYQAPPPEALREAPADLRSRQVEMQHSSTYNARFEGESTTHRDFKVHPVQALSDASPVLLEEDIDASKLPFEGESSMRAHYQAPPPEALKITPCDAQARQLDLQHASAQAGKFEGESTSHSDFHAHPLQAIREQQPPARLEGVSPAVAFEGESSMRAHYQAPPIEALKTTPADGRSRHGEMQHSSTQAAQAARFEGESTAHRDFPAHPAQALADAHPAYQEGMVASKLRFEGESSMRAHYQAPPPEALRIAPRDAQARQLDLQHASAQVVKFKGESTSHGDFHAHPLQAVHEQHPPARLEGVSPAVAFEGESSMRAHYQAPPIEALKTTPADGRSRHGEMQHSSTQAAQAARFEGESTAHRDFPAHPAQALADAHPAYQEGMVASKLPFEGESSMRAHYQAPSPEALRIAPRDGQARQLDLQHASAQAGKFEGESTSHSDFHAHPLQAIREQQPPARLEGVSPAAAFEGESSMRAHYQAPPIEALKTTPADGRSRHGELQHSSTQAAQAARFEGESTAHRDFPAHPAQALADAHPAYQEGMVASKLRFEGESSMRAHYQAPPPEALRIAPCDGQARQLDLQHASAQAGKFEGESTSHSDFHAHPLQAIREQQPPARLEGVSPAVAFEGESSMRAHYQAPPIEALKTTPADGRSRHGEMQHSSTQAAQAARFEGESTAHRDFPAHPAQALADAHPAYQEGMVASKLPFEGESLMRAHYQAPPPEALRIAPCDGQARQLDYQHASAQVVKFEGESTSHGDFHAHPLQAIREQQPPARLEGVSPAVAFEGESSMRAHYQAPPIEALRTTPADGRSRHGEMQHSSTQAAQAARFEGESTAHRDFPAHPAQALADAHPAYQEGMVASKLPFEGESLMRAHYQAPPPEALRIAPCDAQARQLDLQHASAQAAKFEGESTSHSDFHAHPLQAIREQQPPAQLEGVSPAVAFEGESSMRAHYQAPPIEALKTTPADGRSRHSEMQHSSTQAAQAARFEGESTAHRDFPAHPAQALVDAHPPYQEGMVASKLPFEGESSMRAHYQAPSPEALRIAPRDGQARQLDLQHASAQAGKFEGESTSHSDFHAHPLQAIREQQPPARLEGVSPAAAFEGESSMRAHYQTPPPEALKTALAGACKQVQPTVQNVPFIGESTTHHDFHAHPLPTLLGMPRLQAVMKEPSIPFKGESSMKSHYQAPPREAFLPCAAHGPAQQTHVQHDTPQATRFKSQSTAHSECRAHLTERSQIASPLPSTVDQRPRISFHGESSMKAHYQVPPPEALKSAVHQQPAPPTHSVAQSPIFEGESTAHRDFKAPSLEALLQHAAKDNISASARYTAPSGEAMASSREGHSRPPVETLLQLLQPCEDAPQETPASMSQVEPTTRQGFKVPSMEKLRAILHEAEACCAPDGDNVPAMPGKVANTWAQTERATGSPWHPGSVPELGGRYPGRPAGRPSSAGASGWCQDAVQDRGRPPDCNWGHDSFQSQPERQGDRLPQRSIAVEAGCSCSHTRCSRYSKSTGIKLTTGEDFLGGQRSTRHLHTAVARSDKNRDARLELCVWCNAVGPHGTH